MNFTLLGVLFIAAALATTLPMPPAVDGFFIAEQYTRNRLRSPASYAFRRGGHKHSTPVSRAISRTSRSFSPQATTTRIFYQGNRLPNDDECDCGDVAVSNMVDSSYDEKIATEQSERIAVAFAAGQETEQQKTGAADAVIRGKSGRTSNSKTPGEDADEDANESLGFLDRFDKFLDTPYFNPNSYEDDDNSFLGKFANLAKSDYEAFEAVFVGCFFLVLIVIAQDLLRAQMHSAGIGGRLF